MKSTDIQTEEGKRLEDLIKRIKKATGLTQEQIADRITYKREYLSQAKKDGSEKLHNRLESEFAKELENLTSVETPKQRHIKTRNGFKNEGESRNGVKVYEAAPVYAGINTVYHDEHQVPDYVLNIPQFRDCNYGTRASGDSMYPEIRNGDLIICKELPLDARIIFGDIYVIHTKDGIETIKYVQQFVDNEKGEQWVLLVPHNKAAGMGTPIPRHEIIKLFKVRAIFKAY